jgi:hypothetical protein
MIITIEIASEMGVELTFPVKHRALRKKQFDEMTTMKQFSKLTRTLKLITFFTVDSAITSSKSRFEELQSFKGIFGFLMCSTTLKSLDCVELKVCWPKFAETFCLDGSSDVEINDLISELKVIRFTLPDRSVSAMEIFEFVHEAGTPRLLRIDPELVADQADESHNLRVHYLPVVVDEPVVRTVLRTPDLSRDT